MLDEIKTLEAVEMEWSYFACKMDMNVGGARDINAMIWIFISLQNFMCNFQNSLKS